MEFLPDDPPVRRDPDGFAEDLRRNARRALAREDTLYLCVLRAPDAGAAQRLEAHFQLHLYHGEIYCEREPGVFYLQVFAPQERAVPRSCSRTRRTACRASRRSINPFPRTRYK